MLSYHGGDAVTSSHESFRTVTNSFSACNCSMPYPRSPSALLGVSLAVCLTSPVVSPVASIRAEQYVFMKFAPRRLWALIGSSTESALQGSVVRPGSVSALCGVVHDF